MKSSVQETLSRQIAEEVQCIVLEAEQTGKPLELDPFREQLFELFVTANGAGFLNEDTEVDLSAENLCRILSESWGLSEATKKSLEDRTKLPPEHLTRMRLLWSLMRMWMEWTYAWNRWDEFHGS